MCYLCKTNGFIRTSICMENTNKITQSLHKLRTKLCRIVAKITVDNNIFDTVKGFIYLGSAFTTETDVNLKIKHILRIIPTGGTMS